MRFRPTLFVLFAGLGACTDPTIEVPPTDSGAIAVGDPLLSSGFGMARGVDVGSAYTSDGGRLVPNLRFDMEGPLGDLNAARSQLQAHSGNWSFHFPEDAEYSPQIKRRVGDVAVGISAIRVQLWMLTNAPDPRLNIVIKIMRAGNEQVTWYGKEMKASEHVAGEWERFNAELLIRDLDVRADDSVIVDLWNREKAELFVDDLAVSFISGTALSTRAPDANTKRTPLPYAQVRCDSVMRGLQPPGSAVPPAGPVEAPVRQGSSVHWHSAPGDGVALLIDHGRDPFDTLALLRPYCSSVGDLLHFDRLIVSPVTTGLSITAFDVDRAIAEDGTVTETIATFPEPVHTVLHIDLPGQ